MKGSRLFDHTNWKSKKKVITSSDVLFSLKVSMKSKKKKDLHDLRYSVFTESICAEQKKVNTSQDDLFSLKVSMKSKKKGLHDLRCSVFTESIRPEQKKVNTSQDDIFH